MEGDEDPRERGPWSYAWGRVADYNLPYASYARPRVADYYTIRRSQTSTMEYDSDGVWALGLNKPVDYFESQELVFLDQSFVADFELLTFSRWAEMGSSRKQLQATYRRELACLWIDTFIWYNLKAAAYPTADDGFINWFDCCLPVEVQFFDYSAAFEFRINLGGLGAGKLDWAASTPLYHYQEPAIYSPSVACLTKFFFFLSARFCASILFSWDELVLAWRGGLPLDVGLASNPLGSHVRGHLRDIGFFFKEEGRGCFKEKELEFKDVDAGLLAFLSLQSSISFIQEDFLFRSDRLDTLSFMGFIFFYDLGIIRWRVIYFFLRFVWLSRKWGRSFFCASYFFPNQSDYFLFWGHQTKRVDRNN
jgi:hypothetical protein